MSFSNSRKPAGGGWGSIEKRPPTRRPYFANTTAAAKATLSTPAAMTHMRNKRSFFKGRLSALGVVVIYTGYLTSPPNACAVCARGKTGHCEIHGSANVSGQHSSRHAPAESSRPQLGRRRAIGHCRVPDCVRRPSLKTALGERTARFLNGFSGSSSFRIPVQGGWSGAGGGLGMRSPTRATTRVRCKPISSTGTSSIPSATPNCRQPGSRIFGVSKAEFAGRSGERAAIPNNDPEKHMVVR